MLRTLLKTVFLVLIISAPVQAQEGRFGEVFKRIELLRHNRLMSIATEPSATLAPFTTDGCSGGLSWAWENTARDFPWFREAHQSAPPWEACCVTHDRAYHNAGGAAEAQLSYQARLQADEALQSCVAEIGSTRATALADQYGLSPGQVDRIYSQIGAAMFRAVRAGGAPCSGLPWRWGYGYDGCLLGALSE